MKNFLLIAVVSCKNKEGKTKIPSTIGLTQQVDLSTGQPAETLRSAIIYWDVSIPVAGYVTLLPEDSPFVSFLRRQPLLYTFSKYGINETYVSKVGNAISEPRKVGNFLMMLNAHEYRDIGVRLVNDIASELKREIQESQDDKVKVAKIYPINTHFSFPYLT